MRTWIGGLRREIEFSVRLANAGQAVLPYRGMTKGRSPALVKVNREFDKIDSTSLGNR